MATENSVTIYAILLVSFRAVAIGKPERQALQTLTLWQQATIEFTRCAHSIMACSRHVHVSAILSAHPVRGASRIQCQAD